MINKQRNTFVYNAIALALESVDGSREQAYPGFARETILPAIVYSKQGHDVLESVGGFSVQGIRYQIDIRSESYDQLDELEEFIIKQLRPRMYSLGTSADYVEDEISIEPIHRRILVVAID